MSLDSFDPEHLFIRGVVTGELVGYLSGREAKIIEIGNRLAGSDQSCVLFGERGVGKTSVARQVASILAGGNRVFGGPETLDYGREKAFRPCFARVSEDWETVGDLLLECVTADDGADTFVGRYSSALTDEAYASEFSAKFGVSIATVFSGEISRNVSSQNPLQKAQSDRELHTLERTKFRIFQSFMNRARSADPERDPKIIFFVDEMDRRPGLTGLGDALKDLNDVQFCFIGIAATLNDIISDHLSAGRKLTGGGFPIPTLSDPEIEWIFDNATERAGGAVIFTPEFRARVLEYSEGMPWIAQHVGYEALFAELAPARKRGDNQLIIDIKHFGPAMKAAIEQYRALFNEEFAIEAVLDDRGPTGLELLKSVLSRRDSMNETAIKNALPADQSKLKRWIPTALEKFAEAGVLVRRGDSFAFPNALLRIFTRYHIDEIEQPNE